MKIGKLTCYAVAMFLGTGACARTSFAAPDLSSLTNPTVQTLIDTGSTGVMVGSEQFFNFSFIPGGGSTTAAQVHVLPITNTGYGLQFVANWFAADGTSVSDLISYDIKSTDPLLANGAIDLFSNGTAPAPVNGTFTTATLTSQTMQGVPTAPALSTYNDGVTSPIDTTKPDVNYSTTSLPPEVQLQITDSIFAASTAATSGNSGGVATISVLENTFTLVPEPSVAGWIFPPAAILITGLSRSRRQRSISRSR